MLHSFLDRHKDTFFSILSWNYSNDKCNLPHHCFINFEAKVQLLKN